LATNLHDDVVQVVAGRPTASDSVDLIPAHRVPPPEALGTLSAPGKASPTDREVLSSQAVASYVFSGGAKNYLTVNDVNNDDDDVQLTLNSALEFLASGENVTVNDGVNAMAVDCAGRELVSSAAYEVVPVTTACDTVSVGVCTSNLLARGMDGAGIRPPERVIVDVVRSTASSTAHTAVQPLNISQYDDNVHATAINRSDMRSTAINEPDGVANAALAEINCFSRNNNECMQYDGDVGMASDTMSARVRELHRDTIDLTDLFCSMQTRRAQQAPRSQVYTLTDEDYPTAGQRQPDTSPQSTQHTQASTSQPMRPTQQADIFQQELLALADTVMQQRFASHAPAPTDVQSTVLQPATADASHTALISTSMTGHHIAPRQLDTTVPMQPGQRCGLHLPRSKRPASDDSYIELDSTVSIRRHMQRSARPRVMQQTDATQPFSKTRSRVPETTSVVSRHSHRHPPSVRSDRTMVSNRSMAVPVEVVNGVHKLTDTMMDMTRQTRDDAVARERLLLQQQQLMQRDFVERENKRVQVQKEKELLLAEKQQEKELALAQKQHEAQALLVKQQCDVQSLLIDQQRERDRMQEERYLRQREKEMVLAQQQQEKEIALAQKQNDAQAFLVQAQLEREKLAAELNDKRLAQVEADNREKLALTKQLADKRQLRAVRELELKAAS